jgi:hypothetical protein
MWTLADLANEIAAIVAIAAILAHVALWLRTRGY